MNYLMSKKGKIHLIPSALSETEIYNTFPEFNTTVINQLKYFIVENVKTSRRFIRKALPDKNIDELEFFELNKHTSENDLADFVLPCLNGNDVGLLSEAGCPAIADPGARVVAIAHHKDIEVIPLVGASSIILGLMASGLNGQSFQFHGYLPKERGKRIKKIKQLEQFAQRQNQTQLFIETPYRNNHLLEDLLASCNPTTKLCIAKDMMGESQWIKTKKISDWKKTPLPDLNKIPTVFLIL